MIDKGPKKKTLKPEIKTGAIKTSEIKQVTPSSLKVKKTSKALPLSNPSAKAEKIKKAGALKKVISPAVHKKAGAAEKSAVKKKKITTVKAAETAKAAKPQATAKKTAIKTEVKPVTLKPKEAPKKVAAEKKAVPKTKLTAVKKTSVPVKNKIIIKGTKIAERPENKPIKQIKMNKVVIPQTTDNKEKRKPSAAEKKVATSTTKKKSVSAIKKPLKAGKTSKTTGKTIEASSTVETKAIAGLKEKKKIEKLVSKEKEKAEGRTKEKAVSKTSIKSPLETFLTDKKKIEKTSGLKQSVRSAAEKEVKISAKRILKIFLPAERYTKESIREIPYMELPVEYGENELLLMVVDPDVIYANWEIEEADIIGKNDVLYIRFFDVTGVEFDGANAHGFLDIKLDSRIGSGFYDIRMHGKDVIAEIGLLGPGGRFRPVLRSNKVSIPQLVTFDELGIAQKLFDSGIPVGY